MGHEMRDGCAKMGAGAPCGPPPRGYKWSSLQVTKGVRGVPELSPGPHASAPAGALGGAPRGREAREGRADMGARAPCQHPRWGHGWGSLRGAKRVRGVPQSRRGRHASTLTGAKVEFSSGHEMCEGCAELGAGAPWRRPQLDPGWRSMWAQGVLKLTRGRHGDTPTWTFVGAPHGRQGAREGCAITGEGAKRTRKWMGERERMRVDEMERRAAAESKRGAIAREGRETNIMAWMGRERMGRRKETRGAARSNRGLKAQ